MTFTCTTSSVQRAVNNGTTRTNAFGTILTTNTTGLSTFNNATVNGGGTTYSSNSINIGGVQFIAKTAGGTTLYNHTIMTPSGLAINNGNVTLSNCL